MSGSFESRPSGTGWLVGGFKLLPECGATLLSRLADTHTHTGWGGVVGWQWRLLKHVIVITSISLICQIPSTREAEE